MKCAVIIVLSCFSFVAKSQKIVEIYFNLYTDSLKKGVYNYINVDGKDSTGKYLPLMANEIEFTSSVGKWEGNSLILDTAIKIDSVLVTACLKNKPSIKKKIVLYLKKQEEDSMLPTEEDLINKWKKKKQ